LVFSLVSCSTIIDILIDSALNSHDDDDDHPRHSSHSRGDDSEKPPRPKKTDPAPSGRLSGFSKPYRDSDHESKSDTHYGHRGNIVTTAVTMTIMK